MGNNQSNTRSPNRKTFRIESTEEHSGWIRCHLDDYVTYKNGSYNRIDFDNSWGKGGSVFFLGALFGKDSELVVIDTSVGSYLSIDLNMTANYDSGHDFSFYSNFSGIHNTWRSEENAPSVFEGFMEANRELVKELEELRARRAFLIEYSRWLTQIESSTSYNLPPR